MSISKKNKFNFLQLLSIILLVSALAAGLTSTVTYAQKGMGDYEGVGRRRIKPPIVRLSGIVKKIETHPCKNTTGRAELGTHLIIKDTRNQKLNIHLGPAEDVSQIAKCLSAGKKINVLGFRTEKMPANQYIAQTVPLDDRVFHLRDSMLRPFWSRSSILPTVRRIDAPEVGSQHRGNSKLDSGYGFQRRCWACRYCGYGRCFRRCFYKGGFGFGHINRRWCRDNILRLKSPNTVIR